MPSSSPASAGRAAEGSDASRADAGPGAATEGAARGRPEAEESDEVLSRYVDMHAANRDRLIAAQQAAGVPYTNVTHVTNNYDQSK